MKQQQHPTPQQVGRAGELFVAAELNRRGALATLYLTNTPRVDVVALSPDGNRTVNIQVKTKGPRSASWQWDLNKARAEEHAAESDYMVLVDLAPAQPAYYVCPLHEVARHCLARSQALLKKQGGTRPKNPASTHTVILLEMVKAGKDAWDILRVAPQRE